MLKMLVRKDALQILVDWVIGNVEHVLIRTAPILAPVPSAFALAYALSKAGWPYAFVLGGIIEFVGIGAGVMIAYIETHNQKYPDRSIPGWLGYAVFTFYVLIAALLIFGFETLPVIADHRIGLASTSVLVKSIVPLFFPGLTLIGAVIMGVRNYMRQIDDEVARIQERTEAAQDAKQRQTDVEFELDMEMKRREAEQKLEMQRAEAEQKLAIERMKAEARLSKPVSKSASNPVQMDTGLDGQNGVQSKGTVDDMIAVFRRNPTASYRSVGDQIRRSPQTISNWLDDLEANGRIERNNGSGVRIRE